MRQALTEAEKAFDLDEVPIGCVIVRDDRVVAKGHNLTEQLKDATAHAEMMAITSASAALESRYLTETTLYVTIEPCAMCAGAIVLARIPQLVFGAYDIKAGACGTLYNMLNVHRLFRHIFERSELKRTLQPEHYPRIGFNIGSPGCTDLNAVRPSQADSIVIENG